MTELTQERLKELLDYDPETGVFTRLVTRGPACVGDVAGYVRHDGYRLIMIDGKQYLAHRLAWFYVHGRWPIQIDHINGIRNDNRIENLREAKNQIEQQQNQKLHNNNTSGYPGVSWDKPSGKWRACIRAYGKNRYLGYFDKIEEAARARRNAKKRLHKFCPEIRSA